MLLKHLVREKYCCAIPHVIPIPGMTCKHVTNNSRMTTQKLREVVCDLLRGCVGWECLLNLRRAIQLAGN